MNKATANNIFIPDLTIMFTRNEERCIKRHL